MTVELQILSCAGLVTCSRMVVTPGIPGIMACGRVMYAEKFVLSNSDSVTAKVVPQLL